MEFYEGDREAQIDVEDASRFRMTRRSLQPTGEAADDVGPIGGETDLMDRPDACIRGRDGKMGEPFPGSSPEARRAIVRAVMPAPRCRGEFTLAEDR